MTKIMMNAKTIAAIIVALIVYMMPGTARAQCTGQFAAGALCGNPTGSQAPPKSALPSAFGLSTNALTNAHIFVGNVSNVATDVAMSGNISITNAGVTTLVSGSASNLNSGTLPSGRLTGSYTGITGVGTLAAGATGAGFTVALGASTITGTLTVSNGGTGATTLGSGLPLFGAGTSAITTGTLSGNTTKLVTTTGTLTSGNCVQIDASGNFIQASAACGTGNGTVTSIATTSPITGGTITTTGTIACATCVTSAAALTANSLVIGGGLQATSVTTTGTGILTALGINVGSAGAPVTFNGAGGTPSSITLTNGTGLPTTGLTGTLQAAQEPAHTGDVTNSAGSLALTIANAAVTYAKIANLGALAVMGRSANSSGVGADIQATAASDAVLRESGSTIGFGTIATAGIANNAVTLAKLATQATNTVLGNATAGTAVPTALAVGTCSTAASALIWTTNTGFGCNTSITAAAVPASGLTGTTLAINVVASSLTSVGTLTGGATGAGFTIALSTSTLTGITPVVNGGTGLASGTSGGVLAFTAAGTIASSGALTANNPVIGGGVGVAPSSGTRSGTTTVFATATGALTPGNCVQIDANGNFVDAGGACTTGGGGGTVSAGTAGQMTYYGSTGTVVIGNPNVTVSSGAVTFGISGSVLGSVVLAGNTSGAITIKGQAAAGTFNLNLPTTAGTAGQLLTSQGGGATAMTWTSPTNIDASKGWPIWAMIGGI